MFFKFRIEELLGRINSSFYFKFDSLFVWICFILIWTLSILSASIILWYFKWITQVLYTLNLLFVSSITHVSQRCLLLAGSLSHCWIHTSSFTKFGHFDIVLFQWYLWTAWFQVWLSISSYAWLRLEWFVLLGHRYLIQSLEIISRCWLPCRPRSLTVRWIQRWARLSHITF